MTAEGNRAFFGVMKIFEIDCAIAENLQKYERK